MLKVKVMLICIMNIFKMVKGKKLLSPLNSKSYMGFAISKHNINWHRTTIIIMIIIIIIIIKIIIIIIITIISATSVNRTRRPKYWRNLCNCQIDS